jgi:hypothetical protein
MTSPSDATERQFINFNSSYYFDIDITCSHSYTHLAIFPCIAYKQLHIIMTDLECNTGGTFEANNSQL